MAYEFQKLSEVEALTEVPEGASVLAEVNGDIKRIPGNGLGGNGDKTLVIVDSTFTNGGAPRGGIATTYTTNMTLDEALVAFRNCELTGGVSYTYMNGPTMVTMEAIVDLSEDIAMDCLLMVVDNVELFWTVDGISTEDPGGGNM